MFALSGLVQGLSEVRLFRFVLENELSFIYVFEPGLVVAKRRSVEGFGLGGWERDVASVGHCRYNYIEFDGLFIFNK